MAVTYKAIQITTPDTAFSEELYRQINNLINKMQESELTDAEVICSLYNLSSEDEENFTETKLDMKEWSLTNEE